MSLSPGKCNALPPAGASRRRSLGLAFSHTSRQGDGAQDGASN
ncbi:hypothetical protein [Dyella sp. C11]|nr:hypothetical protein [Dyella sp. C11]